jgi:hypothetical protein
MMHYGLPFGGHNEEGYRGANKVMVVGFLEKRRRAMAR